MIKDFEWLDLAAKTAQRNVSECIDKSAERHLSEHHVQFLPKIETITIDVHGYDNYFRSPSSQRDFYDNFYNNSGIGQSHSYNAFGKILGVFQ